MERESFENNNVAKILNESFISIKVDREERPDIDNIYMTYCQVLTGSGGWPLSIFMTCDKKPFFAGTYFPKNTRYGRPGLIEILENITDAWKNNKEKILESSDSMLKDISQLENREHGIKFDNDIVKKAVQQLKNHYDPRHGGFSDMPKFPTPHNLFFLSRYYSHEKDEDALKMVEYTLQSMYKGGIFDHVGFGFSRYSTDSKWLVPHFEKMLYDNALLALAYTEAYHITKNKLYKKIADKIFIYLLRDMKHQGGGFYSAEDADSEGVEGKFYVWTKQEVIDVLGSQDAEIFMKYYDITDRGNFEEKNIPNLINTDINEIQCSISLEESLDKMLQKLFEAREKRVHPFKDDKILTSWNGLMLAALSYAGRVFDNKDYIDVAEETAKFLLHKLVREDGRLLARFRNGEAANTALLEDYAYFVWGLLETYEATFDSVYLEKAALFNEEMLRLFYDIVHGGFYIYGEDSEQLIMRPKDFYDGALPSGNSSALMNLTRLMKILGRQEYSVFIDKTFDFAAGIVTENPAAYSFLVEAYLLNITPGKEIVISGNRFYPKVKSMIKAVNAEFMPFSTVILNDNDDILTGLIPFIKEQKEIAGEAAAYICQNFACSRPTVDLTEFAQLIKK